jgi:predicted dehydrogenase
MPDVQIVCMCELSGLVRWFSKKVLPAIELTKDTDELLGLNPDAIYVTTPAPSHYSIVKSIITKSKNMHIFVEKPLTIDYNQSKKLSELAIGHGNVYAVGYHKRCGATFKMAKMYLTDGQIGEITSFSAHAYSSDFFGIDKFVPQAYARGGVIRDLGCHAIDMVYWLFGEMDVTGAKFVLKTQGKENYTDAVKAGIQIADGSEGTLDVSWVVPNFRLPEIGVQINGTKGCIMVTEEIFRCTPNGKDAVTKRRYELEHGVPFFLAEEDYYHEDRNFIDAINNGTDLQPDFGAASKTDLAIEIIIAKCVQ